jgi:hypothetical protein
MQHDPAITARIQKQIEAIGAETVEEALLHLLERSGIKGISTRMSSKARGTGKYSPTA